MLTQGALCLSNFSCSLEVVVCLSSPLLCEKNDYVADIKLNFSPLFLVLIVQSWVCTSIFYLSLPILLSLSFMTPISSRQILTLPGGGPECVLW